MAPHPIKRRKLEHDSEEDSLHGGHVSNDDHSSEESEDDERPSKIQKMKSASKSAGEQNVDNAAMYSGDLYKSSMFKMQVDEMLSEIRPNYEKRMGPVNEALRKLKTIIENITDREPLGVSLCYKVIPWVRTDEVIGRRCHEVNSQIT